MTVKDCRCGERGGTVDSRPAPNGWRRRYRCTVCGYSWTTLEVMGEGKGNGRAMTVNEHALRRRVALRIQDVVGTAINEWLASGDVPARVTTGSEK